MLTLHIKIWPSTSLSSSLKANLANKKLFLLVPCTGERFFGNGTRNSYDTTLRILAPLGMAPYDDGTRAHGAERKEDVFCVSYELSTLIIHGTCPKIERIKGPKKKKGESSHQNIMSK